MSPKYALHGDADGIVYEEIIYGSNYRNILPRRRASFP